MKKRPSYLELKSCDGTGFFCGYASIFNVVDHHREKVAKGAFTQTLHQWRKIGEWPRMLWQHDPKYPIGVWENIVEDECGLFVKGRLLLDIQKGRETFSLIQSGAITGLSIGFQTKKSRCEPVSKIRVLEEIDLYEISLVTFAANPLARVTEKGAYSKPTYQEINQLVQKISLLNQEIKTLTHYLNY
ncbi:MAG: HK97 family phage prohead protease [Proteobacteria bacterium]|nr:HK97 family phage prohead protease [Pseudomonadota bacterium]